MVMMAMPKHLQWIKRKERRKVRSISQEPITDMYINIMFAGWNVSIAAGGEQREKEED